MAEGPQGRALDFEDVQHFQRILKVLAETDRIMKTRRFGRLRTVPLVNVLFY